MGKVNRAFLIAISLLPQVSFGWGFLGHSIVASVGSEITDSKNPFWSNNKNGMAELSVIPDRRWKSGPSANIEKPTHWFEPDGYFTSPNQFNQIPQSYEDAIKNFGEKHVTKYGTAVWRIQQFAALATDAVNAGRFEEALQLAGVMSHYIGDDAQPLHVTINYDGQLTGQKGIHKYFETDLLEQQDRDELRAQVLKRAQELLKTPEFRAMMNQSVIEIAFDQVNRSYAEKDAVLMLDQKHGRGAKGQDQLLEIAINRMADGAATLAVVLNKIWSEAGSPRSGATLQVKAPAWVKPDYSRHATLVWQIGPSLHSHSGNHSHGSQSWELPWDTDDCFM